MNAAKLKQAIIKEVSRSPGKTVVLIALLPVAAYFCFPLFKRFLPTRSAEGAATSTVVDSMPPLLLPAATAPAPMEQALPDWRQVLNWIATDQLAAPTPLTLAARSPFQLPAAPDGPEASQAEMEQEKDSRAESNGEVEQASNVVTLQDLDLKFTATIVSGNIRLATINGRVLREGNTFRAKGQGDEATGAAWEVSGVKIGRRTVVLQHGNETAELSLPPDLPENAVLVKTIRD